MSGEERTEKLHRDLGSTRRQSLRGELGRTGLRQYGGIIDEEFLVQLRGVRGARVFREMAENDPTVGAFLFAIEMLLRNVDWRVEPWSDDPEHLDQAEFVESLRDDLEHTWEDFVAEVGSMFVYGYAPFEIVYKRREGMAHRDGSRRSRHDDGRIGWRKLAIRAQTSVERWDLDEQGDVLGLVQRTDDGHHAYIPAEKLLNFRTTSRKNSPEGRSALRNAFLPWYRKRRIEEAEAIGVERDLAGMPVFKLAPEYFDNDAIYNEYKRIAENITNDEQASLILPAVFDEHGNELVKFELTGASGSPRRLFDTTKIADRYDRQIATTVVADFLLLGHEKVGSFALSSDKTSLFATALGAWLKEYAAPLNRHALPRLYALNGWDPAETARFVPGDLEKEDVERFVGALEKLVGIGIITPGGEDDEAHWRQALGMPEKPDDLDRPPPPEVPTGDEASGVPAEDPTV